MLNSRTGRIGRQVGMILVMTLIVLVAMTLAAVALTRSSDTANLIAANLAFQQSVTQSADLGLEAAVNWLETNNGATLYASNAALGYSAVGSDPSSGHSWDDFWTSTLAGQSVAARKDNGGNAQKDEAGNYVYYAIQRLCYGPNAEGHKSSDPNTDCDLPNTTGQSMGNGMGAGFLAPTANASQVNYRITVRIEGPRNTLSYVQAVVAL
jgi:type IV pilus assembly protein PilX